MNDRTDSENAANDRHAREKVLDLLRTRNAKARFMTEVYAALGRLRIGAREVDRAVGELEKAGLVMTRDHFCADPHLAGVDLRVAALVASRDGADPQASAIRVIDEAWNKWLNEYLANHRCG